MRSSGSSQRGKRRRENGETTTNVVRKKPANRQALTKAQQEEIAALAALPDDEIDCSDIPEITNFDNFVHGMFRPLKKSITIRIDADVLAWIQSEGPGYQTRINYMLRLAMRKLKEAEATKRQSQ
jgi:uncharacterized protein (DUF4415 family)